jgi:hypothetical protein
MDRKSLRNAENAANARARAQAARNREENKAIKLLADVNREIRKQAQAASERAAAEYAAERDARITAADIAYLNRIA